VACPHRPRVHHGVEVDHDVGRGQLMPGAGAQAEQEQRMVWLPSVKVAQRFESGAVARAAVEGKEVADAALIEIQARRRVSSSKNWLKPSRARSVAIHLGGELAEGPRAWPSPDGRKSGPPEPRIERHLTQAEARGEHHHRFCRSKPSREDAAPVLRASR